MPWKISFKWSLFIVSVSVGIASSSIFLSLSLPVPALSSSGQSSVVAFPKQEDPPVRQAGSGLPLRIKIPKIRVDAVLEHVGLTPQGAVDVPKGPTKAAWYKLGPRPGDNGNAIIVGHYGWKNGKPSTFDNLHKLRKGDTIYVEDDAGETISFVVRESRRYDPKADAVDVFYAKDGKEHLNLITCEGVWNKIFKSYSKRLVVFADKVVE